jgi:hypothetical protein
MPVLVQVEVDWSLDEETQREYALWQEGDEAVGNSFGLRLVRILYEALIASYLPPPHPDGRGGKRPFWVDFEVGVAGPAGTRLFLVPDLFLSLDIERPVKVAMYKLSAAGKPPELVVEVVSETPGGELEHKLEIYASWGIQYYLVFDWAGWLGEELAIHAFSLENGRYVRLEEPYFAKLGLGVRLWRGCFEDDREQVYMRFCDESGELLPTNSERRIEAARRADEATALSKRDRSLAERESMRAERATIRAEQEKARAEQEKAIAAQERARADQEKARADAEARARQLAEEEVRELRRRLEEIASNS